MVDKKILLILSLISLVSTANVVIIGDSRAVSFAYNIIGFDYTYHNDVYGTGSYIIGDNARNFGGHSIKVIAEVGASYSTFQDPNKAVTHAVQRVLGSAQKGTVVLFWLGVNNLNVEGTFGYYQSLANYYVKCKFFAVSVTGVGPRCKNISNEEIRTFNINLRNKIQKAHLSNLKYKSILNNDDPTQIYNSDSSKVTFVVTESTTDYYGLHYNINGDRAILLAMLTDI